MKSRNFKSFENATETDLALIVSEAANHPPQQADRIISLLMTLEQSDARGHPINTFEHMLQSATRARRLGGDDEDVVVALLHDIGDEIAPHNHGEFAANLLAPFIDEKNHWLLEFHAPFQGYYFWHAFGGDRNAREKYRGHPYFQHTLEFIERIDMPSFDADYDTAPLSEFIPAIKRVFDREPKRRDPVIT
ncbi:MAG: HD domain-containing protein [Pseudomonadota bacterium]